MARKTLKKTTAELKQMVEKGVTDKLTTMDRIWLWYNQDESDHRITLTEKEETIRKRWSAAFHLLVNFHSKDQAVKVMMKEYELSEATAYRDLFNAERIFGDVLASNKAAMRHIVSEWTIRTFQMAMKQKDVDGMNQAIRNLIKIHGIDRDEFDASIFENIQVPEPVIKVNEEGRKLLETLARQGAVNLSQLRDELKENTIDITPEEVTNE